MTEQNAVDTTLKVVQIFAASVDAVFQAWTDPAKVKQWMGPGQVICNDVKIDLKSGGKYSIAMQTPDGEHPTAVGVYKEIVPGKKLQFTWSWENGPMPDTLVTVEFKEADGGTELTLTHENFPDKETATKHTEGWKGCLAGLQEFLA